MKYQTYLHTNEFERIAGMIMPLPYMFVASLKSNETNINYATKHILLTKATFQKQFDRAQKKCGKLNAQNNQTIHVTEEKKTSFSLIPFVIWLDSSHNRLIHII